jgi:ABC-type spermidine/putrescine transport system permease subunit II
VVEGGMALPIVVPEICLGVAMLVFFRARDAMAAMDLPWPLNLGAIIIAHVSFAFPFVATVVRARLSSFNRELEEAAKDLGASEWRTFWDILVPHMQPGLIAGALLAFTLSLDDFVITFFTSRAGYDHVPGESLFDAALLGDAGGERGVDHPDRRHRDPDGCRSADADPRATDKKA